MSDKSYSKAIALAEEYVRREGRPLEGALLRYRSAGPGDRPAAAEALLAELGRFRNDDGGFGRALEPDYRARGSSVLATNMALSIMSEAGAGRELLRPALSFLLSAYDAAEGVWPIVPGDGDLEPHAPWWTASKLRESFGGFLLNPSAECVAHLISLGDPQESRLGLSLLPAMVERARSAVGRFPSEAIDSVRKLASTPGLPGDARSILRDALRSAAIELVERDEGKWSQYCLRPYRAAPDPAAPGAEELEPLVRRSLEWLVATQEEDGSFAPNWSWFGLFPESWPQADKDWRGILALGSAEALRVWAPEGKA